MSISLRNPYRNPWDFSHPHSSPLVPGVSVHFLGLRNLTSMHVFLAVLKVPLAPRVKALIVFPVFKEVN